MKRLLWCFAALALVLCAAPALAKEVSGSITFDFDLSGHPQGKEVKLWVPYPTSDERQLISDLKYEGDFAEAAVYTDRRYQTPMLYARWPESAKSRKLTLTFHAVRQEIIRRDFPAKETAWDPMDYQEYLGATRLGPIDGEVKKLADKITKGQTTVLGKAKAIYDWTCENMYRDPKTRGCGPGDVCELLQNPGGKCADIHSVYISLARAAGVPCREIFGIRMATENNKDITTWYHCWAEFFLPGYGWVPVDPADVRKKMLVEKLELADPKTKTYREYFWGGIDAYRVKLSKGRDLVLAPPQKGGPVNYLMYPFAQVGGETLDWLDPAQFKYKVTFNN
ncbi:transglutaminase [Desulfocarbo indianensis]|nr:transglutaminase [Desulfocarbo indianensis]